MSPPALFSWSERAGILLLAQTSALSASAILGLLSYIAYSAVTVWGGARRRWRIESAAEILFLNQLGWDLVQAMGGLMNIKWAASGSVHQGSYCVAQGAVKHISDVGSALSTVVIALYTLKVLCFSTASGEVADNGQVNDANSEDERRQRERERKKSLNLGIGVVVGIWLLLGLVVGINIGVDGSFHFYGPTGFWCWIQSHYSVQRIAADYAFMWTAAAFNIVAYLMIVLYIRGYFRTKGWRIYLPKPREPMSLSVMRTYGLLFYPLIYILAVLPLSIARYLSFAHHHVPFAAIVVVDVIYLATGLFNVLLFSFTRPFLLPHDLPNPDIALEAPYNEGQDDNGAYAEPAAVPRDHHGDYEPRVHSVAGATFLSSEMGDGDASGSGRGMGLTPSPPARTIDFDHV